MGILSVTLVSSMLCTVITASSGESLTNVASGWAQINNDNLKGITSSSFKPLLFVSSTLPQIKVGAFSPKDA